MAERLHTQERAACQGWTPEQVVRLRQRVAEYATLEELAEEFGRSPSALRTKVYRLGLQILARPENRPHEWGGEWHPIQGRKAIEKKPAARPAKADKPKPEPPKRTMVALMQQMIRLTEDTLGAADILSCQADEEAEIASVLCRAADGRTYQWKWEGVE